MAGLALVLGSLAIVCGAVSITAAIADRRKRRQP